MARVNTIKAIRTTRANLNTQAAAGGLFQGELYLITDEGRFAIGTGTTTYAECLMDTDLASVADLRGGVAGKIVAADTVEDALDFYPMSSSTTPQANHDNGINQKITLTANATMNVPTNGHVGSGLNFLITQDGTGSRTMAWNTAFDFGDASAPVLSTAASSSDLVTFECLGAAKFGFLGVRKRVD